MTELKVPAPIWCWGRDVPGFTRFCPPDAMLSLLHVPLWNAELRRMKVKLAVRDWDYITPLVFGDVKPEGFELEVHRVADLPRDMNGEFDASEFSMSRYSTGRAKGDTGIH